eukprot:TRINITY_DN16479_c0_g1_i1.p1 TRINITY_DN16479_c0_g1~~TRINITY_DN16479_c0_g1_i1.p1  ORF type:complete len:679 (+),score=136.03 TRINITY_DN16479_c0_g1_i1:44-2038(+)
MKRRQHRDGSERMIVVVRVRVLTERERQLCSLRYPHRTHVSYKCVECVDNDVIVTDPDSPEGSCSRRYSFDRVFDEDSTNDDVYSATVKPLLSGLLEGYNATCFAYGMTGAGKTFTMMGADRIKGLCTMAVEELFPKIESMPGKCAVHASYLEIYNEKIKDLLSRNDARKHDIIEDPEKGVMVTDLAEYLVTNLQDLHTLMSLGCEKRTRASTSSNVVSSRSHAILLITVKHQSDAKMASIGKLALIDLAGSERAGPGETRQSKRVQEGANINRSLLALGNCITILGAGRERRHVPYRDSKLTRLLKDSLGGNTRTVMIGNTSPSSTCYEELVSTLKYASRARNISRHVTRNAVAVSPETPKHVEKIIMSDVRQLQQQLSIGRSPPNIIQHTMDPKPFIAIPVDNNIGTKIVDNNCDILDPIKKVVTSCFCLRSTFDDTIPHEIDASNKSSATTTTTTQMEVSNSVDKILPIDSIAADCNSELGISKMSILSSDEWDMIGDLIRGCEDRQQRLEEVPTVPEARRRDDNHYEDGCGIDDGDGDGVDVDVGIDVVREVQNAVAVESDSVLMEEMVAKKSASRSRRPRERRSAVDHSTDNESSGKWRGTRACWRGGCADPLIVETVASLASPRKSGLPSATAPSPTLPCSSTKMSAISRNEALVLFP